MEIMELHDDSSENNITHPDCLQKCGEIANQFADKWEPSYYILIVDEIATFESKIRSLNIEEFIRDAPMLVYFSKPTPNFEQTALTLLQILWDSYSFNNVAVVPHPNFHDFYIYSLDFVFKPHTNCLLAGKLTLIDKCERGAYRNTGKMTFFERNSRKTFNNCTVDVTAMPVEPFVITENDGFEITFLRLLGANLNIFFNVSLSANDSWGERVQNEWSQGLGKIDREGYIGIGNVYANREYAEDFDFTVSHFRADLAWIVPRARYVPKWRVLTVIFNWQLWTVCLVLVVFCGGAFFVAFRWSERRESNFYASLCVDLFSSFQVLITAVVFKQPQSVLTRIVFVALAVFSIVISSVYTSSLINYLTTRQRFPQIDSLDDILNADLTIGGLAVYQDIFNVADDEKSMIIYRSYQAVDDLNYWLQKVGDNFDACSIFTDFFIKYKIATKNEFLTDEDGKSVVYVLKRKIFTYNLRILTKDGFPFLNYFNTIIARMDKAGLVLEMVEIYLQALKKVEALDQEESFVQKLSVDHLQGAFAILLLGYVSGAVLFVLEILASLCKKRK